MIFHFNIYNYMIYIILNSFGVQSITDQNWSYIRAIYTHVLQSNRDCYSLMEYAVRFSKFLENIDAERLYKVSYLDDVIQVHYNRPLGIDEVLRPFMEIKYLSLI